MRIKYPGPIQLELKVEMLFCDVGLYEYSYTKAGLGAVPVLEQGLVEHGSLLGLVVWGGLSKRYSE
eukprot:1921190-Amphidinium_carterae.1